MEVVLRDNLFGLEIDPRCTQIAAFNLAWTAWRMVGYRPLPQMNLACSGLGINAREEDWVKLAGKDERARETMRRLYHLFQQAPVLGSLISPKRVGGSLFAAEFEKVRPMLQKALSAEQSSAAEAELAVTAQGLLAATAILTDTFTLVATNVPYLTALKHSEPLKEHCSSYAYEGRNDLATAMLMRWLPSAATTAAIYPHQVMFQVKHGGFRKYFLTSNQLLLLADIGEGGSQAASAAGAFVCLSISSSAKAAQGHIFLTIDAKSAAGPAEKAGCLISAPLRQVDQSVCLGLAIQQLRFRRYPTARRSVNLPSACKEHPQATMTDTFSSSGNTPQSLPGWRAFHGVPSGLNASCDGASRLVRWQEMENDGSPAIRGEAAWGRRGIIFGKMRSLPFSRYFGERFSNSSPVIVPRRESDLGALWAFTASGRLASALRELNPAIAIRKRLFDKNTL